ncbi:hypothetical protein [Brevundimonas sp.]|uniref:hypothetical protein n=1 Tax=Brevundimonas sp. TaxID=1871086 RepID=UPI002EDB8C02
MQDAILGTAVTVDGRRRPRPAARSGFACGVQAVRNCAGRFSVGVTFENRTDHACLTCVDRQFAFSAQIIPVAAASAGEAVLDASDKAAARLVAEFGQEHLVHRALQPDVEFRHVSF